MSFIKYVSQKAVPIWQKCIETDFVQNMGNGTLEKDWFKYYIIQDSIYLRNYARVLAMGIVNASDIQQVKIFSSLLSFVNSSEGDTRIKYLKEFGLTEEKADKYAEHPNNKAYTDFMMDCAKTSDAASILFSALPCMFSYYWIFTELVKQYPESLKGYFAPFINDYINDGYAEICREWADFADNLCKNITENQKENLCKIFIQSSIHELNFFNIKN